MQQFCSLICFLLLSAPLAAAPEHSTATNDAQVFEPAKLPASVKPNLNFDTDVETAAHVPPHAYLPTDTLSLDPINWGSVLISALVAGVIALGAATYRRRQK